MSKTSLSGGSKPLDAEKSRRTMECTLLCRQIFCIEPSPGCLIAYQRAHEVVFGSTAKVEFADQIARAVQGEWDLEALEFALRFKDKSNLLTKKINILFYVMEAMPQNFPVYVNLKDSIFRGWFHLVFQTARSICKLAKGGLLLLRLSRFPSGAPHA